MKKIGAITVGQTPRTDLIHEIAPILGDSIEIIQMGGLDGLTKEEIQTMTPAPGDHVLVSRLKDGSSVSFGESHILPRLEACMDQLKKGPGLPDPLPLHRRISRHIPGRRAVNLPQ